MSLFTFVTDVLGVRSELRRIADALDRIAPLPDTTTPEPLRPDEAVTYVDEEAMAKREREEEMSAMERARAEHPEWFADDEHDTNEEGVDERA